MGVLRRWRGWARGLGRDTLALYLACRDPRTPWYAKLLAGCVAAYAVSPIDLIPDFVPVLGLLDDLVIVPLGILLVRRLVPAPVLDDCRRRAEEGFLRGKGGGWAAAVIVALWLLAAALLVGWLARWAIAFRT